MTTLTENGTGLERKLSGLSLGKGSPPSTTKSSSNGQSHPAGDQNKVNNNSSSSSGPGVSAVTEDVQLPQTFVVKYLGKRDASGLWGIQHTRQPVDEMVAAAKSLKRGATLPILTLEVSSSGVKIEEKPGNLNKDFEAGFHSIREISYGVQDLVYTRVFAMIVVREGDLRDTHPFCCHGFVCDSRDTARRLTFSLATAFKEYGRAIKSDKSGVAKPRKFAIDLRSPEEIQEEMDGGGNIEDSEA